MLCFSKLLREDASGETTNETRKLHQEYDKCDCTRTELAGSQGTWVLLAAWVTPSMSFPSREVSPLWEKEWVSSISGNLRKNSLGWLQKCYIDKTLSMCLMWAGVKWVMVIVMVILIKWYKNDIKLQHADVRMSTRGVQVWSLGTEGHILSWWG